jgi:colicin import membrane protein
MSADTFNNTFNENAEFKSALKWSLIAHVIVFALFTIKAAFFDVEPIDYSAAIRVDIVALPEKLDPNQVSLVKPQEKVKETEVKSKPVALPEKKEKNKEADTINLKKVKSKQQEALEKLKKQSALDKIKNDIQREKNEREALKRIAQVKGNIISPGTALSGLNKLQHENYVAELDRHIKEHWALPEWMSKQDFKTQIRLRVDAKGQIISREIFKSSGNQNYDEIALDTIDQSAPFPIPPEKFVAIFSVQGVLIGFPE